MLYALRHFNIDATRVNRFNLEVTMCQGVICVCSSFYRFVLAKACHNSKLDPKNMIHNSHKDKKTHDYILDCTKMEDLK